MAKSAAQAMGMEYIDYNTLNLHNAFNKVEILKHLFVTSNFICS